MSEEEVVEEMGNEPEATPEESGQEPVASPEGDDSGFNSEQMQQIKSALGRIVKNQFEEITPMLQQNQQPQQRNNSPDYKEQINREFFEDPAGTVEKMLKMHQNAQSNLTRQQKDESKKALTAYSEDPLYKDVFEDADKITQELMGQGYPPEPAAETAFLRARNAYLNNALENQAPGGLGFLQGGKRKSTPKKKNKLPPEHQAQAEKDIASGIFKNMDEYIANLGPATRERLGV